MFWESQAIATGSGVIAEHSSGRYLITAWHNLAGKNPETGAVMSPTGGIPNRVDIEGCHTRLSANLYDGDNDPLTSRPLFAAHPAGLEDRCHPASIARCHKDLSGIGC
jgi:hypothetical protein